MLGMSKYTKMQISFNFCVIPCLSHYEKQVIIISNWGSPQNLHFPYSFYWIFFLTNTYKKIISNNPWGKRKRLLPLSIKNEGHKDLRIYDLTPYDRSPLMKTPAISPFPFHLGNWICEFVAQFWGGTIFDGWRIAFVGNSNVPLMCSEFHFYLLSAL